MTVLHLIGNWLYWFFGCSGTGPMYAFWSGPGSDIGELTIIGGLVALYRRHTCHQQRCWRWARHELVDPDTRQRHLLCAKHHPRGAPSAAVIADIARRIAERSAA